MSTKKNQTLDLSKLEGLIQKNSKGGAIDTKEGQPQMEKDVKKPILEDEIEEAGGKPHIKKLLCRQINHEFDNERLYLSIAIWCENHGYTQTAKFFADHSYEEKKHGMDFINFMAQKGMKIPVPKPNEVQTEFEGLEEALKAALKREYETTAFIQEIYVAAAEIGHPAVMLAHEYLEEQVEEEQLFQSLLALYKLAGPNLYNFESSVMELKTKKGKWKVGALPER
jgi:ferritin